MTRSITPEESRFIENLRALRRQSGLTIRELSDRCRDGTLYQSIRDYESKKCIPAFITVYWVTKALGVKMDELMRNDYTAEPVDQETLGRNIRFLREEWGYSQKKLADRIKKAPGIISGWETGKYAMDANSVKSLCAATGITPFDLLYQDLTALIKEDDGTVITCARCGARISVGQPQCNHCKDLFDWEDENE